MCGIAGIVSKQNRGSIRGMAEALAHRGPDGVGYYENDGVALGHTRLSIIDLEGGAQPISNEDDSLQLVCNGEIYNSPQLRQELIAKGHRFKTRTDVEVILHLYEEHGQRCVSYLRGMFAFAIWDSRSETMFLGRDHMGQKPLFYYSDGDAFVFSSEIKGLFASGLVTPELCLEGLWHYMSLRFMPDQYSLFKGVKKLPAASTLFVKNGQVELSKYWSISFDKKWPGSENELVERLDSVLGETVEAHLLSDVRVGSFLSGGIDSTTIASMMAQRSDSPIPTFSIGVQEHSFNELPAAKIVAEKYGMEQHEKIVHADLIGLLPRMLYHMDEPADPYGVGVYLVSELARETVKVVLSGDGADESFAGYDRYAGQRVVDFYCLLPAWFRNTIMKPIINAVPETFAYKSIAQKTAWVQAMSQFSSGERYAESMSFLRFTPQAKESLFTESAKGQIEDYQSIDKILTHFNATDSNELVDRMLHTDLMTRVPDHNLVIGDRMSMAHSLEVRAPFVDYQVVEFAARLPAKLKLKNGRLKHILRKVGSRYLPKEIVKRRKQGFGFPLGTWMRTDLAGVLEQLLGNSRFAELGIFHQAQVNNIVSEHIAGKVDHSYRLWILLNLEILQRLYFEGESVDSVSEMLQSCMRKA
ncbi:MAG: asparagine synthase (glutamine-hydrolyzing) [Gammaproteobacteria bacterium]|nr:asparagine synthase (glutamine-hydrolyzing) [Gammaproteobacteria bacterium]